MHGSKKTPVRSGVVPLKAGASRFFSLPDDSVADWVAPASAGHRQGILKGVELGVRLRQSLRRLAWPGFMQRDLLLPVWTRFCRARSLFFSASTSTVSIAAGRTGG